MPIRTLLVFIEKQKVVHIKHIIFIHVNMKEIIHYFWNVPSVLQARVSIPKYSKSIYFELKSFLPTSLASIPIWGVSVLKPHFAKTVVSQFDQTPLQVSEHVSGSIS